MELRHLRYLIAVAEEHSFVAAAARLQVAQPALSRQIRDLEKEIGLDLFVRDASGSRLTSAGDACARTARQLLHDVDLAVERARQAAHGLVGKCIIGAGRYPLWNGLFGRLVEQVRDEYSGIEILVEELSLRAQWDALANAEVDVAFGTAPPSEYLQFVVETHSLDVIDAVAVSMDHPLADRTSVSLKDLRSETWVRHAPNVTDEPTRILQSVFSAQGFVPAATRQAANDDALRMLVRAGAGWSALPRSLRAVLPRNLVAIPVEDLAVPFRYVHMHRRGDSRPVVRTVLGALRRAGRKEGIGIMREPDSGIKQMPATQHDRQGFASRIELRHLRYFAAVVECQTIGRAAEQLGITQPGLSRQLRDLEDEIGASLLNRTARGVVPTLAGDTLYQDASRMLRAADQLGSEAHRALRGTAGNCVVGVATSPMIWDVITQAVAICASRLPDTEVSVEDIPTPRQCAALREARIDLALGHHYPALPDVGPNVTRVPLLPDLLNMALIHEDHPLAGRQQISVQELGTLPFLFMKRVFSPNFYDQVMSTFARANYSPRIEGEYDGLPTVWALAAQGIGWCLGSASQLNYPPNGLVAIELTDFELPWGCELSYRGDEARPAVIEVVRAIREAAQAMSTPGMPGMTSQETKYWSDLGLSA